MAFGQPQTFTDFHGGVNAAAGPYLLRENQARAARNFRTTPTGSFRKRNGFTDLISNTDLSSRFDSLHSLFPSNLATKSILVSGKQAAGSNDRIAKIVGTTVTTLKSGLTQGKRWEWVQAPLASGPQGPIYGVNGTDTPQQWDGAASSTSNWTAATGTVPASGKFPIFHTDRIWMIETAHQGRVRYSGLTADAVPAPDPRNWDSDNYVDIEPDDGEDLTGEGSVGPYIVVTKARKTYVITDPVTGAWKKISDEVGCIAHRTIVETTAGTFFLSEDLGVCVTNGETVETEVGENIRPLIREAAANNPTLMSECAAAFFQNSYFLSIPHSDPRNDLLLEYDLQAKSWWIHDISSNQFAILDPAGSPILYSINPAAPKVQRAFTPSSFEDSGNPFTTYLDTAYLAFTEPHLRKRINQIRVDGRGTWTLAGATEFTNDYQEIEGTAWESTDDGGIFGLDGNFAGTGDFGPTPGTAEIRYPTPLDGHPRALSLRFESTDSEDCEIQSLTVFTGLRSD